MTTATVAYGGGWYEWEYDDYFPFRWMSSEAHLVLSASVRSGCRYLSLPISADDERGRQTLTIVADGQALTSIPLLHRWHVYDLDLRSQPQGATGECTLTLRLDSLMPAAMHPGDARELGVRVGPLEPHDDARRHKYVATFYDWGRRRFIEGAAERGAGRPGSAGGFTEDAEYGAPPSAGWHPWQFEGAIPFRWMRQEANVAVPGPASTRHRFCTIPVCCEREDLSQALTVSSGGRVQADVRLLVGWQELTFPMPGGGDEGVALRFRVSETLSAAESRRVAAFLPPAVADAGGLGVRLGLMRFHDDERQYEQSRAFFDNVERNNEEFESGAIEVRSFPLMLGIDLYAKCNIKPHCVYCLWDGSKEMEGDAASAIVDAGTLEGYGPFFDCARHLTNCSIGEPFLHPRLGGVLDLVARRAKMVDLSTNGQAFTPSLVESLAGKPVVLCVSLDAASAETYGRLRNDRWHEVLVALTYLGDVRRHGTGLPHLHMVFMPMRANLQDLEAYFKLCRMVGGEGVMLRPLFSIGDKQIVADRGGYHFDYARELLSEDEMAGVVERCADYSKKYNVALFNQFDFGLEDDTGARRQQGSEVRHAS